MVARELEDLARIMQSAVDDPYSDNEIERDFRDACSAVFTNSYPHGLDRDIITDVVEMIAYQLKNGETNFEVDGICLDCISAVGDISTSAILEWASAHHDRWHYIDDRLSLASEHYTDLFKLLTGAQADYIFERCCAIVQTCQLFVDGFDWERLESRPERTDP